MIQVLLTAYVVVKWFGAWSLLSGAAGICLYSGLLFFAVTGFVSGLLRPPGLFKLALGAIFDGGGDGPLGELGIVVTPALWLLFFTLYPLGLVDWLVALHVLESSQGYFISHDLPSAIDIAALALVIIMFGMPIIRFWRLFKNNNT